MKTTFSDNLIKYRKRMGLTQVQLAGRLSVTPQAVSKWEKGSYPDSELLPDIAKILDVSLDVLFGLKEEDNKVDIYYEAVQKLRRLSDSEKGSFVIELFHNLICGYNPNIIPESISFPESFTKETFAQLRTDYELAVARLNSDMQYACFMRIPDNGINSYFSIKPRITELFRLLADENSLRIICFAETLGRNYILTKECIANELSMPLETVSEIVDRFERFGIMWQLTANTGGAPFPIYGYVHNVPLVAILTLAESLVNFISCREPDIDIWSKAPFRVPDNE